VATNTSIGVGRRKTSVARVFLREGHGEMSINGRTVQEYFPVEAHVSAVQAPLQVTDGLARYDIVITDWTGRRLPSRDRTGIAGPRRGQRFVAEGERNAHARFAHGRTEKVWPSKSATPIPVLEALK
jgi:hypothetical protein